MEPENLLAADAPAPPGHNRPPSPLEVFDPTKLAEGGFLERIRRRVLDRHKAVFDRMAELTVSFKTFPESLGNDEIAGQAGDLFKLMRTVRSRADEFRKIETDPYRTIRSMIDTIFSEPSAELGKLQETLKGRIDKYLADKKEREKAEREAKAKAERDEADRRIAAAAEAEAREAAERLRAETAAREAREAQERKEAAERAARAALERKKRIEAVTPYLQKRAIREAARRKIAEEERVRLAAEAEERRKAAIAKADAERLAQKAAATVARKEETQAKGDRDDALEAVADAKVDQRVELAGAIKQDKRADRADVRANASAADLSRTRGRLGSVGSLSVNWQVISVDHHVVDLNALRGLIAADAVEAAVWKFLQLHRGDAGGPNLAGAVFEQVEGPRIV